MNVFDLIAKENKDINFDADYFHFDFGTQVKLDWAQLVIGVTYSTATAKFEQPNDFPNPDIDLPTNDDPAKIIQSRWRFIIGLEIPIFGKNISIK